MKQITLTGLISFLFFFAYSQTDVRTTFEQVQEKCKNLPPEKKLRLAVARFSVTTPGTGNEFGRNIATMLTNALQGTSCYRVLEQLDNLDDLKGEIEFGKSEDSDGETNVQQGKMLSAQVIVTGEVTEYSVQSKKVNIGIVKTGKSVSKIGFIVKVLNPQTREILFSKSVNVQGQTGSSTDVGVGLPFGRGISFGGGSNLDPAVANALEKGIIESIEFLAGKKDELSYLNKDTLNNTPGLVKTEVKIEGADYNSIAKLATDFKKIPGVTVVQKSFSGGIGILKLTHSGNSEELLDKIIEKFGNKITVNDLKPGKINLKLNSS